MPCRDYMDDMLPGGRDYETLKKRNDMLSRIACAALTHIEQSDDGLEVLILREPEVRDWWAAHKEADRKERDRLAAAELARKQKDERRRIREEVLASLTPEQRAAIFSKE